MADTIYRRPFSTLPRPASLLIPDLRDSIPIVDTSSYSPFPTFPGSDHARDPYGLNAYLLHPSDLTSSYVDSAPAPKLNPSNPRPESLDMDRSKSLGRQKSVTKHRSLSMLRRPSPLGSQPPLSLEDDAARHSSSRRQRSNSVDSATRRATDESPNQSMAELIQDSTSKTPHPLGKKSFRRAFQFGRKSFFGQSSEVEPVPLVPELPVTITTSANEDFSPGTPTSSRTNSSYSLMSSASSGGSSEGVKTPFESILLDVGIAGEKLAGALADAEEKKGKVKSWREWLGGKKGSKMSSPHDPQLGFAVSDPLARLSTTVIAADLLAVPTPKLTLTPSPSIDSPTVLLDSLIFPSDDLRQHTHASDHLRRISTRKMSQLRQPSPHPLALSLRRQQCNLPDEVAFSLTSGQKVFPMSVNEPQQPGSGLSPAQGGLWLSIAISIIMTKLDAGQQLPSNLMARKDPVPMIVTRPRGLIDFVDRPPFEERMMVYYADDRYSPISMARPEHGVWDLDFSKYILALSEVDEPANPWPMIPRASFEGDIGNLDTLMTVVKLDSTEHPEGDPARSLVDGDDYTNPVQLRMEPDKSIVAGPDPRVPLSSFRNTRRESKMWDYSSEEDSEGGSDDEPLARVVKKRSDPSLLKPDIPAHPKLVVTHERARSQPGTATLSTRNTREAEFRWKEVQQKTAAAEVAKARERREAAMSGETERRAMAAQRRSEYAALPLAKRSSTVDLSNPSVRRARHPSSGKHLITVSTSFTDRSLVVPGTANRRRVQNQNGVILRPEATRQRSTAEAASRRYYSFYEAPAASTNFPSLPPPAGAMYPHPALYAFPQQTMLFPPWVSMGSVEHSSRSSLHAPSHSIPVNRRRMA